MKGRIYKKGEKENQAEEEICERGEEEERKREESEMEEGRGEQTQIHDMLVISHIVSTLCYVM